MYKLGHFTIQLKKPTYTPPLSNQFIPNRHLSDDG